MDEEELFPTFDIEDYPEEDTTDEIDYTNSPYFDDEKGDLILDEKGQLVLATEEETWEQWCTKACQTERIEFLGYSELYGAEIDEIFNYSSKQEQESQLEKTFTEACLADPLDRTLQVADFSFEWGVDSVIVSFSIIGTNEMSAQLDIEINIKKGINYG